MKDWLPTLLKIIITFAVLIVICNDLGMIIWTRYQTSQIAQEVAQASAQTYGRSKSIDLTLSTAQKSASEQGAKLTGFEVTEKEIRVEVETTTKKTLVIQRIKPLKAYLSSKMVASNNIF